MRTKKQMAYDAIAEQRPEWVEHADDPWLTCKDCGAEKPKHWPWCAHYKKDNK